MNISDRDLDRLRALAAAYDSAVTAWSAASDTWEAAYTPDNASRLAGAKKAADAAAHALASWVSALVGGDER